MKRELLKRFSALAVALVMIIGSSMAVFAGEDTEIYENQDIVKQDFENVELESTEIDNINICITTNKTESGAITVVEYGQDKDKVLKYTKLKGGTEIAHYTDLGSDNGIKAGTEFVLEMSVMFETAIPNTNLIEGRKVDKQNKPQFMAFLKANGTGFTVPGTDEMIQKIQQWQWYVVSIVVNDQLREYDIYIDGALKAENVPFASEEAKFSSSNNYSCLRALNLTGHSSPITAYADDISLIYGTEPIYKGEVQDPADDKDDESKDDKDEEDEEEEEEVETLFPAVDIKPTTTKESSMLKESASDKIYLIVLGSLGVCAVVFSTVIRKKDNKQAK